MIRQLKHILLIYSLLFSTFFIKGQNLVPNPGFEEMISCPPVATHDYGRSLFYTHYWNNAHMGSCDYLHSCLDESNFKSGSLGFLVNRPEPRSGEACIGFVVYSPDVFYGSQDYREFPLVELSAPLRANVEYEIEINLKIAESSNYYISNLNVYFLKDLREIYTESRTNEVLIQSRYDEERNLSYDHFISNSDKWKSIYLTYKAKGGERYLVLGNMASNIETNKMKAGLPPKDGAYKSFTYYLIDDLWMSEKGQALVNANFKPEFRWNIRNLEFKTGNAELNKKRFADLDRLIELLQKNTSLGLNIIGHTDKEGDKTFNLALSFDRAKNVRQYLVNGGIDKSRLKISGMGSIQPIATNRSDEGKQKNRRVEIEVISIP